MAVTNDDSTLDYMIYHAKWNDDIRNIDHTVFSICWRFALLLLCGHFAERQSILTHRANMREYSIEAGQILNPYPKVHVVNYCGLDTNGDGEVDAVARRVSQEPNSRVPTLNSGTVTKNHKYLFEEWDGEMKENPVSVDVYCKKQ